MHGEGQSRGVRHEGTHIARSLLRVLEVRARDVLLPSLAELLHFRVWVVDDPDVLIMTPAGSVDLGRQCLKDHLQPRRQPLMLSTLPAFEDLLASVLVARCARPSVWCEGCKQTVSVDSS
jgi:hypothetical protein